MSQDTNGVHRCPSCDELADASYGEDGSVTCLKCGYVTQRAVPAVRRRRARVTKLGGGGLIQRDVVSRRGDLEEVPKVRTRLPEPKQPTSTTQKLERDEISSSRKEVIEEEQGKKTIRRRKKKTGIRLSRVIFITLWFTCIFAALWVVRKKRQDSRTVLPKEEIERTAVDEVEKQKRAEATGYVNNAMPECAETLRNYLKAPDAAARAQYVRLGKVLAPEMTTHYSQNTAFKLEEQWYFEKSRANLVLHEKLRAIESVMLIGEEEEREVVFVREDRAWKLDWEFFVKHSTSPWHLFLSEVGPKKGTFRVYARLREATGQADVADVLRLRFYPPMQDPLVRNRGGSPAVLVPIASESGQRMQRVIETKKNETLTGQRSFHKEDPDDLFRVRVILEWREGTDGERYLHLNKVLAGNWLGRGFEDFPGMEDVDGSSL